MVEVINFIASNAREIIGLLSSNSPPWFLLGMIVFFTALGIAVASLAIYYFCAFSSKRDLLKINLNQYNYADHPVLKKVLAICFYLIEYIIILPFFIVLSFVILAVVVLLISYEGQSVNSVLLISAAIILAIRLLAYTKKEVAKDLASLFPYSALFIFLLTPSTFSIERFTTQANEIPILFENILYYLIVIVVVEALLRGFSTINLLFKSEEKREEMSSKFFVSKL